MIPLVALSFLLQLLLEDTDSTLRVAIPCTSDSQSLVLHLLFYFSLTSSRQESLVHALVLVLRKLFGELSPKRVLLLSSSFSRSCLLVSLLSPVPVLLLLLLLFRDKKSDWQKEEVRRVLQVHLNMLQKDWLKGRPCKDCLKSGWSAIRFAVKYTCPLSMSAYLTVSFSCLPWILPCNSWQFQLFSDAYSSSLAAFSSVNAFSSSFESDSLIANREVSSFFFSNIQFFILILVCERDSYISFLIIKAILHSWFSHSSNLSFKYRETDSSAKNFLLLQSRESNCPRVSLRTSFYYCPGDLVKGVHSLLLQNLSLPRRRDWTRDRTTIQFHCSCSPSSSILLDDDSLRVLISLSFTTSTSSLRDSTSKEDNLENEFLFDERLFLRICLWSQVSSVWSLFSRKLHSWLLCRS